MQQQGLLSKALWWESIQSQRSHYCMTPFIRYSGIQLSGFGVRQLRTQVLGGSEMTLHLHCGASARNLRMYEDLQDLYTITTTKFYSLYANLEDIAPGLFWSLGSTLVNKAGTWVISHSVVCSLTAENTKVPPPGQLTGAVSWSGNQHWQDIHGAMCRVPGSAGVGMEVPKMKKVSFSLLQGFVTQLDEWKRQIPNNWRAFNSSYIWRPFILMPIFYR